MSAKPARPTFEPDTASPSGSSPGGPSSSGPNLSGEVQSVAAALRLLEAVAGQEGLGMSELAGRAGMTHNQTHRLLATLEGSGYVERDASRRYHLGPKLALFESGQGRFRRLLEAAREPMDTLSALSGESVLLAVRVGLDRMVIDRRLSTFSLRVDWAVGSRLPLYVGGLGVALLAFSPAGVLEALLSSERRAFTESTLRGEAELRAELERVRASGVRVSVDDWAVGEFSVAAAVRGPDGLARAAVNVAGFTARLTPERRAQYLEAVPHAAAQIALALGRVG